VEEDARATYTNDDKLRWEIEKLMAETKNLTRPYIKSPSSWITLMTVILGVFGVGIQYFKSDREYQLAEIKRQQAALETEKTSAIRQQALEEITQAKNTLDKLQSEREAVSQNLNGLQAKVTQLEEKAASLASAGDVKQVVQ
jgi:chromosome segregation ATPase